MEWRKIPETSSWRPYHPHPILKYTCSGCFLVPAHRSRIRRVQSRSWQRLGEEHRSSQQRQRRRYSQFLGGGAQQLHGDVQSVQWQFSAGSHGQRSLYADVAQCRCATFLVHGQLEHTQSSVQSDGGEPGYEFTVCGDGFVHPQPVARVSK